MDIGKHLRVIEVDEGFNAGSFVQSPSHKPHTASVEKSEGLSDMDLGAKESASDFNSGLGDADGH